MKNATTRYLVRITSACNESYRHLVGRVAIAYSHGPAVELLRLPAADPSLGGQRYLRAGGVTVELIRPTTFDDFEEAIPE